MGKTRLITVTPNAEELVIEIARVSSSRKDKTVGGAGLLRYLIKNKHWSPFEHGYMTLEFITSKSIAIQFLRHRSFTFQELSQRYQDVGKVFDDIFEPIELRKQATDNRQSSDEVINPRLESGALASIDIRIHLLSSQQLYNKLLAEGVSRETARFVLPVATKTRLFMTGNIRSWIHFFGLRDDGHAQKEAQELAQQAKQIFIKEFPIISKVLEYDKIN